MKLAITYDPTNQCIFQHFGKTETFKVYTVENNEVKDVHLLGSNGQGHGALAGLLSDAGIDAIVCGGIGEGAQNALKAKNIKVYCGVNGNCDMAAIAFAEGTLVYSENHTCDHHGHHHENGCGHICG